MTNEEIGRIAREQSAVDLNCSPEDFHKKENVAVHSREREGCRRYLKPPFFCSLVSYGSNIVASVDPVVEEIVRGYMDRPDIQSCFETPHIYALNEALGQYDHKICFQAEYFLPDVNRMTLKDCGYELRILTKEDFGGLYLPEWSNALCEDRKELDVLGVGAYDRGKLIGLAGCSADCASMWQIGIDVLLPYRRQGIAKALTGRLAREILDRDKVPFYCAAWSNVKSARNAVSCGFYPAWAEMTAKPSAFIKEMLAKG